MNDTILACIITGVINLIGVYVANSGTRYKIISMLKTQDAVQDERIKTLTASVNRHNNFAERIPKLEVQIESNAKEIAMLRKEIDELKKEK